MLEIPEKPARRIRFRAEDVFGFQAEVVATVDVAA